MARAVIAIMAIVVVGAISVWGLQAAAADAGDQTQIDGESFAPTAGSVTQLDHSGLANAYYDETVDVYDSNGNRVDAGEDYVWHQSNGTITTVTGGALDGESSATIDYDYQRTTEDQQALIGIAAILPRVLGVLVPLLGVALLFIFLGGN